MKKWVKKTLLVLVAVFVIVSVLIAIFFWNDLRPPKVEELYDRWELSKYYLNGDTVPSNKLLIIEIKQDGTFIRYYDDDGDGLFSENEKSSGTWNAIGTVRNNRGERYRLQFRLAEFNGEALRNGHVKLSKKDENGNIVELIFYRT